jgi:hypothetical protein
MTIKEGLQFAAVMIIGWSILGTSMLTCVYCACNDRFNQKTCYEFNVNGSKHVVVATGCCYKSSEGGITVRGYSKNGSGLTLTCTDCAVREWDCTANYPKDFGIGGK